MKQAARLGISSKKELEDMKPETVEKILASLDKGLPVDFVARKNGVSGKTVAAIQVCRGIPEPGEDFLKEKRPAREKDYSKRLDYLEKAKPDAETINGFGNSKTWGRANQSLDD